MKNDGFIKVAAITSNVHLNDIDSNVNDIVAKAKEANEMGARISFDWLLSSRYVCSIQHFRKS